MPEGNAMRRQDDFAELVKEDRAHGSIYTSQAVFDAEMERIFHRTWVCVGHASEIPNPGDFRVTRIGLQSVIMVRGADDEVRVLMNRCRHRGVSLTESETGSQKNFVCPYHGWAYSNTGALISVPDSEGYGPEWRFGDFGMTPAPRFWACRRFLFSRPLPFGRLRAEHL